MSTLTPVAPRERIATLDVLRGFALLGVLLGNTYWLYSVRVFEAPPDTSRWDTIARWAQALFVESNPTQPEARRRNFRAAKILVSSVAPSDLLIS